MNYKEDVLKKVTEIFRRDLGDENLIINYDSSPNTLEKWDSINNLILISSIEEEYKINIPTEVIFEIDNVGNICDFIVKASVKEGL